MQGATEQGPQLWHSQQPPSPTCRTPGKLDSFPNLSDPWQVPGDTGSFGVFHPRRHSDGYIYPQPQAALAGRRASSPRLSPQGPRASTNRRPRRYSDGSPPTGRPHPFPPFTPFIAHPSNSHIPPESPPLPLHTQYPHSWSTAALSPLPSHSAVPPHNTPRSSLGTIHSTTSFPTTCHHPYHTHPPSSPSVSLSCPHCHNDLTLLATASPSYHHHCHQQLHRSRLDDFLATSPAEISCSSPAPATFLHSSDACYMVAPTPSRSQAEQCLGSLHATSSGTSSPVSLLHQHNAQVHTRAASSLPSPQTRVPLSLSPLSPPSCSPYTPASPLGSKPLHSPHHTPKLSQDHHPPSSAPSTPSSGGGFRPLTPSIHHAPPILPSATRQSSRLLPAMFSNPLFRTNAAPYAHYDG